MAFVRTALPAGGPAFSRQFLLSMGIMAIIILAVSVWAVRRVTAPLAALSSAAERLGTDVNAPPMPETGTIETRQASRAFNDMQARLRSLIENRTRMLAAISHDLRTPLTLLRLRAENVENAPERDKMLATIAEMDSMIGATLQFARDEAAGGAAPSNRSHGASLQHRRRHGRRGTSRWLEPAEPIVRECQPAALKRAIRNLLDNAVKYGKARERRSVRRRRRSKSRSMTTDQEFPKKSCRACFSRSIASKDPEVAKPAELVLDWQSHCRSCRRTAGSLTLTNRPEGGLRALVTLPNGPAL